MRHNKKAFVIVDAYTTGRFLAPYLNANGYTCIHVQSRDPVIDVYLATFTREHFVDNLIYTNNISELIECLDSYEVKGVIPGAETGVLLADQLSEALQLPTSNGTGASLARRDKYEMIKQLNSCNVRHAQSFKSSNLNEIIGWAKQNNRFPVVIKPLASSGSYGVKVCGTIDDISNAFNEIMHQGNVFNEKNTEVLIQQFLDGQEYIVNTVSYEGRHRIVDVWRKFKKLVDGIPINDYSELVSADELIYSELQPYISEVLNALEIKFGAGHSEIMVTHEGPVLIETAARLAGSIDPSALMESIGDNQVASLLKSYMQPEEFLQLLHPNKPTKYARHIFFVSPISGIVNNSPDINSITELSSFHSVSFRFDKGDHLLKTTTLADFPGFCYLVSDSKAQMENDYHIFRQKEKLLYADMVK